MASPVSSNSGLDTPNDLSITNSSISRENPIKFHLEGHQPTPKPNIRRNIPNNQIPASSSFSSVDNSQLHREQSTYKDKFLRSPSPRVGSWLTSDSSHRHPSRSVSRRRRASPQSEQPIYITNNYINGPTLTPHGVVEDRGLHGMILPSSRAVSRMGSRAVSRVGSRATSPIRGDINYKHSRPISWFARFKYRFALVWEGFKQAYWHIEPWVVRPLIAGACYNLGIQLIRILLSIKFPSLFPTTVYLPLRSEAKLYDLQTSGYVDNTGQLHFDNSSTKNE